MSVSTPNLSSKSLIIRICFIKAVSGTQHPPVVNDGGATSDSIRPLQADLSSHLSQLSAELPTLEIVGGEVRVRFASSALYFLTAAR